MRVSNTVTNNEESFFAFIIKSFYKVINGDQLN